MRCKTCGRAVRENVFSYGSYVSYSDHFLPSLARKSRKRVVNMTLPVLVRAVRGRKRCKRGCKRRKKCKRRGRVQDPIMAKYLTKMPFVRAVRETVRKRKMYVRGVRCM